MSKRSNTQAHAEMSAASRRIFLSSLGAAPGLSALAGAGLLSTLAAPDAVADAGPLTADQRRYRAFVIRRDAAILQRDRPAQISTANSDEQLYANRIGSFSKA